MVTTTTEQATPAPAAAPAPMPAPAPAPAPKPAKTSAKDRIDATKAAALEAGAQLGVQGAREFQAAQRDIAAQKSAALRTYGDVGRTAGFAATPTFASGIGAAYQNRMDALTQSQANFLASNLSAQQQIGNYLSNAAAASESDVADVLRRSRGGGGGGGGGGGRRTSSKTDSASKLTQTGLASMLYRNAAAVREGTVNALISDAEVKRKALADIASSRKRFADQGFTGTPQGPQTWDEARTVYLRQHQKARDAWNWAQQESKRRDTDLNSVLGNAAKRFGTDVDQIHRAGQALEGRVGRYKGERTGDAIRYSRDVMSYYRPRQEAANKQLWYLGANEATAQKSLDKQMREIAKQGRRPLLDIATELVQPEIDSGRLTPQQVMNAIGKPGLSNTWEEAFAREHNVDYSGQRQPFVPELWGKQQGWNDARVAKAASINQYVYQTKDGGVTLDQNDPNIIVVSKKDGKTEAALGDKDVQKNLKDWTRAAEDQGTNPSLYGTFINYLLSNTNKVGSYGLAVARVKNQLGTMDRDAQDAFDLAAAAVRSQFPDQAPTKNATDAYITSILSRFGY